MFVRSASLSAKTDQGGTTSFSLDCRDRGFDAVRLPGRSRRRTALAQNSPAKRSPGSCHSAPGGGYDIYSRLIEPHLEAALGAEIAVINVEGAGGVVGTNGSARRLATAEPSAWSMPPDWSRRSCSARNGAQPRDRSDGDRDPDHGRPRLAGSVRRSDRLGRGSVPNRATQRPIVIPDLRRGVATFVSSGVTAALLGIRHEFVAGYSGTNETASALLRDEGDVADFELSSGQANIAAGDLRPLLRPGRRPEVGCRAGRGIPRIDWGRRARGPRAALQGRDVAQARRQADALSAMSALGRMIVGPRDLRSRDRHLPADRPSGRS